MNQMLRFHAYERDGSVSISGEIYVNTKNLTSMERGRVISRVIRGIPELLKNVPYSDFGFDNIRVSRVRRNQ